MPASRAASRMTQMAAWRRSGSASAAARAQRSTMASVGRLLPAKEGLAPLNETPRLSRSCFSAASENDMRRNLPSFRPCIAGPERRGCARFEVRYVLFLLEKHARNPAWHNPWDGRRPCKTRAASARVTHDMRSQGCLSGGLFLRALPHAFQTERTCTRRASQPRESVSNHDLQEVI